MIPMGFRAGVSLLEKEMYKSDLMPAADTKASIHREAKLGARVQSARLRSLSAARSLEMTLFSDLKATWASIHRRKGLQDLSSSHDSGKLRHWGSRHHPFGNRRRFRRLWILH